MKLIRQIVSVVMLTVALNGMAQAQDWANFKRYEQADSALNATRNNGRRVVFMGNSITELWYKMRPEFFNDNEFVGRGISGQTSYQMLLRFRDDVINLRPAAVVINCGTNDVAINNHPYVEDRTFGNIVSMAELARANGIVPILSSVLPAAGFGWRKEVTDAPDKIASLNARIKEYADANCMLYIDYYTPLVYGENRALNPKYTKDGVHPIPAGYEVMEATVLPIVRSVVK